MCTQILVHNYFDRIHRYARSVFMEENEKSLYDIFLNYSYSQLKQMFSKAESEEEKNFYMTLENLVL